MVMVSLAPPSPGSREAAFVYAISSAGVVYTLARACSQGDLESCSCDPTKKGSSRDTKGAFDWGGCSDHVEHAMRFSQVFVDAKERKEKDARALINLHNNRAGRKASRRRTRALMPIRRGIEGRDQERRRGKSRGTERERRRGKRRGGERRRGGRIG